MTMGPEPDESEVRGLPELSELSEHTEFSEHSQFCNQNSTFNGDDNQDSTAIKIQLSNIIKIQLSDNEKTNSYNGTRGFGRRTGLGVGARVP